VINTVKVLDINLDVTYSVGAEIVITNICLEGQTGYDLTELLTTYVIERAKEQLMEIAGVSKS
jgi:hypothetical protein